LLHRQGKDSEALLYADRAKARVLLDAIRGRDNKFANVLTEAERLKHEALNKRIADINRQILLREREPSATLDDLYKALDSARLEFELFQDRIYVGHPQLKLRSGPVGLTAETINALHQSSDEAFLEYVIDEHKVGLFLITGGRATTKVEIKYIGLVIAPKELELKVEQFHRLLAERRPGFETLGNELYQSLIQPVAGYPRDVKTLCIIPDGVLWNLPFQALITADKQYLLETCSIYYAPSLSVLHAMSKPTNRPKKTG